VVARREGAIVGGCQILHRRVGRVATIGSAPRAPLAREAALIPEITKGVERLARQAGIRYLKVQPAREQEWFVPELTAAGHRESGLEAAPTATVVLDLGRPFEEIQAGLRSSTRRNVKRAEKRGVVVRSGGEEDVETFARLVRMTAQRLDFRVYTDDYYARMWGEFQPDSRMLIAEYEGEPVAATMILGWGEWAHQKVGGWNGDKGVPFPNELLRWNGISWAHERGFRWYDFEGMEVAQARALLAGEPEDEVADGAVRFKLQFGGDPTLFPPAYDRGFGLAALPVRALAPRAERLRGVAFRLMGRRTQ
jgi:lipid II:glycine glycyltransferase (peptidoglycan interpeptide bridge formation enzyme)